MKTFTISLLLTLSSLASAAIINVPADQATIQAGINAAVDGDTVLIAEGTYVENINYTGKAITVASRYIMDQDTSHISKTIIDGSQPMNPDSASTVLFVSGEDTTSILTGLTITGGGGTIWIGTPGKVMCGGGIFCNRSGARIEKNIIRNNVIDATDRTAEGGGIASEANGVNCMVIIEDNIIKDNRAESETAYAEDGGLGIFSNCRIVGNVIQNNVVKSPRYPSGAGAIGMGQWSNMLVENNDIQGNQSINAGDDFILAVVVISGGKVRFVNNHLHENETISNKGTLGVGMFVSGMAQATIKGNRFTNNIYKSENFSLPKACYVLQSQNVLVDSNYIHENDGVGGLYINNSAAIVRQNTITNNKCYYGAGVCGWKSTVLIENNVITGNVATQGSAGGWLADMKSALIQNNIICNNDAGAKGGGGLAIYTYENNNLASQQAIDIDHPQHSRVSMSQCTSSDEILSIPDLGAIVLFNNTICNNKAGTVGGGFYVTKPRTYSINNIVWGNTAQQSGAAQIWNPKDSLTVEYCNVQGGWPNGANIMNKDPLFVEDTFELSDFSPCIGAGLSSININGAELHCSDLDCLGNLRPNPAGTNPDLGAFEHERAEPEGTSVTALENVPLTDFSLAQNYPNPFNPTTTIEYQLPNHGHVILSIHNLAGQHIRTLVDAQQNGGHHSVEWDARDEYGISVSSGVYLYKLHIFREAKEVFQMDKKMVLLR